MTRWRPVSYVTLRDAELRRDIVDALHELGWAVVVLDSGVHLIQAMSGVILGDHPWLQVGLVVVDDASPGCRGATIVRGLRDLGIAVPVALIASGADPEVVELDDPGDRVYVLEPALAAIGVAAIARGHDHGDERGSGDGGEEESSIGALRSATPRMAS